jgi:hypothetical protein
VAARAVAEGNDLEVLELAIRTAMTRLGAALLEGLLAAIAARAEAISSRRFLPLPPDPDFAYIDLAAAD